MASHENIEEIVHAFVNNCRCLVELTSQLPDYRRKVVQVEHINVYSDEIFGINMSVMYFSDGVKHTGAVFRGSQSAGASYNTETGNLFIYNSGKLKYLLDLNKLVTKHNSRLKDMLLASATEHPVSLGTR